MVAIILNRDEGGELRAIIQNPETFTGKLPEAELLQAIAETIEALQACSGKLSEIYIDLGFETLSHFSFAFKKQFGLSPTELTERKQASR